MYKRLIIIILTTFLFLFDLAFRAGTAAPGRCWFSPLINHSLQNGVTTDAASTTLSIGVKGMKIRGVEERKFTTHSFLEAAAAPTAAAAAASAQTMARREKETPQKSKSLNG